jgi:hypothetical protein
VLVFRIGTADGILEGNRDKGAKIISSAASFLLGTLANFFPGELTFPHFHFPQGSILHKPFRVEVNVRYEGILNKYYVLLYYRAYAHLTYLPYYPSIMRWIVDRYK